MERAIREAGIESDFDTNERPAGILVRGARLTYQSGQSMKLIRERQERIPATGCESPKTQGGMLWKIA
jgi:hypothetical protein